MRTLTNAGETTYQTAVTATLEAYKGLGFNVPPDISGTGILVGLGSSIAPEELPDVGQMPDAGPDTIKYFRHEVHPELTRLATEEDPRVLELAKRTGRLLCAAYEIELVPFADPLPLRIENGSVYSDGLRPKPVIKPSQMGTVVDYGMGVTGIVTHLDNVRAGHYRVTGLQKTPVEAQLLSGFAEQGGIADGATVLSGGIANNTHAMPSDSTDIIIASRVHMAGGDLTAGIDDAGRLLTSKGLLVARGPRRYDRGVGYDAVLNQIKDNGALHIAANKTFNRLHPGSNRLEPNRVIIARKP